MSAGLRIHALQALRAIAASLVVIDHTLLELTGNAPDNPMTSVAWALGNTGVYTFFVVSGFIMVLVSWSSFGGARAGANFLCRRIVRIVPLYWLGTLVALGYHKISATHGADDSWRELVYSLVCIPYRGRGGGWSPILPQGWTLNYEMMFYLIFALGLCAPRKFGIPIVCIVLLFFTFAGRYAQDATIVYLASPIILWFLLGIVLAVGCKTLRFNEPVWVSKPALILEPIGDASYSIYLVHGLVLTLLLRIWIDALGAPPIALLPLSLAGAIGMGWITYLVIEKPLLGLLNGGNKIKKRTLSSARSPTFTT